MYLARPPLQTHAVSDIAHLAIQRTCAAPHVTCRRTCDCFFVVFLTCCYLQVFACRCGCMTPGAACLLLNTWCALADITRVC